MNIEENRLLGKTFLWMFLGLLISACVAWFAYVSGAFESMLTSNSFYIVLLLEIAIVFIFNFLFRKMPPIAVGILYFLYAIINGLTLAVIFYAFELNSIIYLFLLSALVFAILAYIGFNTNQDLNSWTTYITIFFIIAIVLSLINIFIQNSIFDLVVDWIVLIVFCAITIYDLNKMRNLQYDENINSDSISIYCAMQLYLDFINIFLRILSIFGKKRD